MPKKRRTIDQFLSHGRKSQDLLLAERTQLFHRMARLVVMGFIMIFLAVLADPVNPLHGIGVAVVLCLFTVLGGLCLNRLHPGVFDKGAFRKFIFLVLLTIGLYRLIIFAHWSTYLTPLPMFAMIVAMAYSQVAGLLVVPAFAFFMALTSPAAIHDQSLSYRIDFPLAMVLTVGGVTAILGVRRVRRQSKPAIVGFYAGVAQALCIFAIEVMRRGFDPTALLDPLRLNQVLIDPAWGFLGGLISGGMVTVFLPAVERFFQILTDRRLLDLKDLSNELLTVLRNRAQGTFQHTLSVSQLARNAAEAIGADPLLAEVGTLYHDVGKIVKPEYFVENMGEDRGIHDRLRASMSKMIIISHVKDGIDLARDSGLPQRIIDMIPMHHGTTVVEYFYQKARRECTEAEDAPGELEYRYPGPKPRFREAGILMLADTVEAIAKTETEPNPSRFRAMVHDQVLKRLLDGQLDESDLTLNDLRKIEESFVRTLTTMYHNRIKYPHPDPPDGGARPPFVPGPPGGERRPGPDAGREGTQRPLARRSAAL
jgi:putative nucleotidyltransferase with HDIG domain